MVAAGWYPDPLGRAQVRYFDGEEWSQWAADDGRSRLDAEAVLTALPPPPDAPPPGVPPPPAAGWSPAQTGSSGTTSQFRSIKGLATALTWILPVVVLVCLGAAGAYANHMHVGDKVYRGDFSVTVKEVDDAKDAVNGLVGVFAAFQIAVFVLLIIWMF